MKKFVARLISFFLDLMLISLIVSFIANTSLFVEHASDITLIRNEAYRINEEYKKLDEEIDDILNDAVVSSEEFNYMHTNFINFRVVFDDIRPDVNVSKDYIDTFHERLDEAYKDKYNDELFRIALASRHENIIAIIIYLLYFGVLQYFLKGQTIFKKLFRLKVVDNTNIRMRIPIWKFILRTILICDIIFIAADLIAISNLELSRYLTFNGVLGNIRYFYEVAFILVIFLRDDQRSIHDLLFNTKVVRFNKEGKIIREVIFKNIDNGKEKAKE